VGFITISGASGQEEVSATSAGAQVLNQVRESQTEGASSTVGNGSPGEAPE